MGKKLTEREELTAKLVFPKEIGCYIRKPSAISFNTNYHAFDRHVIEFRGARSENI